MESEDIKEFIRTTIQDGDLDKIKALFKRDCFNILDQEHFIELWEEKEYKLLEILLIVNREHNFDEINGYKFPKRFNDYILRNLKPKLINIFEKLEDIDIETLVWLDYANILKEKDFSKFSENSVIKFIKNYYRTVLLSEKYTLTASRKVINIFERKIGSSLSTPVEKLIRTILELNDYKDAYMIETYGWLKLLSQKDLYGLLNDPKLDVFKKIFKSLKKKTYEYH
ncbi:MAG: hypothetical protein ACW96X_03615, partial [Promethearchaeota archaeon]